MLARVPAALLLVGHAAALPTRYELLPYESEPASAALVHAGSARFAVLTSRLIRLEYDPNRIFEDRPTLAFPNRRLPVPAFKVERVGAGVRIVTEHVKLAYDGGPFSAASLRVSPAVGAPPFKSWRFGDTSASDPGNLRGTIRTLDLLDNVTLDCAKHDERESHCAWALVSRSGWALVDDSRAPVLNASDDWWTDRRTRQLLRSRSAIDLYLFAHAHDYGGALRDFSLAAGRAPLPARRTLGVWFTRWYDYSGAELRALLEQLEAESMPVDLLVLDMNWHTKWDWTGYSWDSQLFPFPADLSSWLRLRAIGLMANLHDASGVLPSEDRFEALCDALGLDPARPPSAAGVPFDLTNRSYAFALEDQLLLPLERGGVDSWCARPPLPRLPSAPSRIPRALRPSRILCSLRSLSEGRGLRVGDWQARRILAPLWAGAALGGMSSTRAAPARQLAHARSPCALPPLRACRWIDWQQGEERGGTGQDERGRMNPTVWLNKLRATDAKRRCLAGLGCDSARRLPLGRWGGLGTHR
jgi:hypothetical protein